MKENLKTYTLACLVVASILLTLGIWNTTPKYEAIDTPQYATNIAYNDPSYQRTFASVVVPRSIILHFGEQKHAALFPGQSGYDAALDLLRQAMISDIGITTDYGEEEWRKIVNDSESLQFEFDATLPSSTLENAQLMRFNSRVEASLQLKTLYVFRTQGDNDLRALFYGGPDNRMYFARVVLPKDKYAKLFETEKDDPAYGLYGQSLHRNFYLPLEKTTVPNYTMVATPDTQMERLADTFFIDKSLARRVLERDNSQIITDGSRLVRLGARDHILDYRNLELEQPQSKQQDADFAVTKALDFANEHGGFTGQVLLHENELTSATRPDLRSFEFRQVVDGKPVIGSASAIDVDVLGYDIASMRRSQYAVGSKPYKETGKSDVLSGADVLKLVQTSSWLDRNRISDVYLAYLMRDPEDQFAALQPVWVVEQAPDKRAGLFDAVTGERMTSEEGILRGLE